MQDIDACIRCGAVLRDSDVEYPPVYIPGRGEMCADCYNALSSSEKYSYFRGV